MGGWAVERIVHFEPGDFLREGLAHFGFRDRAGAYYAIEHARHFLALVGADGRPEWTVAAQPVLDGVRNVAAGLEYPMYADTLPDGSVLVSCLGNARLYRIDPARAAAELLVDGRALGLRDMGNCVVAADGSVWVNEVTGCRVRQFDAGGNLLRTLGDGEPGFEAEETSFGEVRFGWIYDLRRGPDGALYVLDSGNFALRLIDPRTRSVRTLAGDGTPATFGSDPAARWDGPISLSVDEAGNAYVGDRFNHVVREVARGGAITTIAGRRDADDTRANDPSERDPRRLNLPQISSMDYHAGRLYVPTDLDGGGGDLVVLRRG